MNRKGVHFLLATFEIFFNLKKILSKNINAKKTTHLFNFFYLRVLFRANFLVLSHHLQWKNISYLPSTDPAVSSVGCQCQTNNYSRPDWIHTYFLFCCIWNDSINYGTGFHKILIYRNSIELQEFIICYYSVLIDFECTVYMKVLHYTSVFDVVILGYHWKTYTMERQLNYSLVKRLSVPNVKGKLSV